MEIDFPNLNGGFLAETMCNTQNSSQLYRNKNHSEGLDAANGMQTGHA